jgi:hypothetical protein
MLAEIVWRRGKPEPEKWHPKNNITSEAKKGFTRSLSLPGFEYGVLGEGKDKGHELTIMINNVKQTAVIVLIDIH